MLPSEEIISSINGNDVSTLMTSTDLNEVRY
jgi:hypothetical protein